MTWEAEAAQPTRPISTCQDNHSEYDEDEFEYYDEEEEAEQEEDESKGVDPSEMIKKDKIPKEEQAMMEEMSDIEKAIIKKKEQDDKIKEKALKSPKIILVGNAK